jgi:hypothetical protein
MSSILNEPDSAGSFNFAYLKSKAPSDSAIRCAVTPPSTTACSLAWLPELLMTATQREIT